MHKTLTTAVIDFLTAQNPKLCWHISACSHRKTLISLNKQADGPAALQLPLGSGGLKWVPQLQQADCGMLSACVSDMCMTTAIIIQGRWSDLTPTNHVWPASQDRVPSVWCCPTPHWLVNEGLCGGVRAGWWWRRGGTAKGVGRTLTSPLQLQACIGPAVDSQFFCHHNKQRPHKSRPAARGRQCGTLAGFPGPPKRSPGYQFLHCRYGNRAVSIGIRVRSVWLHSSVSPPLPFSLHFYLLPPPLSLLPPTLLLSILVLSPAPLQKQLQKKPLFFSPCTLS